MCIRDRDKALCIGSPGRFKQRPEGAEHDVVGTALSITFDQRKELITLDRRAKVVQGGSTLNGRLITYNLATEKAVVEGGGTVSSRASEGVGEGDSLSEAELPAEAARASMVLQPRDKSGANAQGEADEKDANEDEAGAAAKAAGEDETGAAAKGAGEGGA